MSEHEDTMASEDTEMDTGSESDHDVQNQENEAAQVEYITSLQNSRVLLCLCPLHVIISLVSELIFYHAGLQWRWEGDCACG